VHTWADVDEQTAQTKHTFLVVDKSAIQGVPNLLLANFDQFFLASNSPVAGKQVTPAEAVKEYLKATRELAQKKNSMKELAKQSIVKHIKNFELTGADCAILSSCTFTKQELQDICNSVGIHLPLSKKRKVDLVGLLQKRQNEASLDVEQKIH
jgi:hypothetical protein